MGYTHYFPKLQSTSSLAYAAKKLINETDVSIKGGFGVGKPKINKDEIWFNGDKELDEDCETFYISKDCDEFQFCKTWRKPYDEVVVALFIFAIVNEEPGFESIRSDGRFHDWVNHGGVGLYEKCFGPLSPTDKKKVRNQIG